MSCFHISLASWCLLSFAYTCFWFCAALCWLSGGSSSPLFNLFGWTSMRWTSCCFLSHFALLSSFHWSRNLFGWYRCPSWFLSFSPCRYCCLTHFNWGLLWSRLWISCSWSWFRFFTGWSFGWRSFDQIINCKFLFWRRLSRFWHSLWAWSSYHSSWSSKIARTTITCVSSLGVSVWIALTTDRGSSSSLADLRSSNSGSSWHVIL